MYTSICMSKSMRWLVANCMRISMFMISNDMCAAVVLHAGNKYICVRAGFYKKRCQSMRILWPSSTACNNRTCKGNGCRSKCVPKEICKWKIMNKCLVGWAGVSALGDDDSGYNFTSYTQTHAEHYNAIKYIMLPYDVYSSPMVCHSTNVCCLHDMMLKCLRPLS